MTNGEVGGPSSASCSAAASPAPPSLPLQDTSAAQFQDSALVWVRLGQSWWPGRVVALHRCPQDFTKELKKTPLAVVKFFEESGYVDIHKAEHIYPYNCPRKKEFIKKGIKFHLEWMAEIGSARHKSKDHKNSQTKKDLYQKFEADVLTAETLCGGEQTIFSTIEEEIKKRRIDYSNLGFGTPAAPKTKKAKKGEETRSKQGSDITQAVRYKHAGKKAAAGGDSPPKLVQHAVRIMEQPAVQDMREDLSASCNSYRCTLCEFHCTRLGVIVWHYKWHLNTVCDYDSGIRIPGKRRRRGKKNKGPKAKKAAGEPKTPAKATNGHPPPGPNGSLEAQKILLDWDEEEGSSSSSSSEDEAQEGPQRVPMPAAEEINSAFDALLADTPCDPSEYRNDDSGFTNNDSDSDASDWEKYYVDPSETNDTEANSSTEVDDTEAIKTVEINGSVETNETTNSKEVTENTETAMEMDAENSEIRKGRENGEVSKEVADMEGDWSEDEEESTENSHSLEMNSRETVSEDFKECKGVSVEEKSVNEDSEINEKTSSESILAEWENDSEDSPVQNVEDEIARAIAERHDDSDLDDDMERCDTPDLFDQPSLQAPEESTQIEKCSYPDINENAVQSSQIKETPHKPQTSPDTIENTLSQRSNKDDPSKSTSHTESPLVSSPLKSSPASPRPPSPPPSITAAPSPTPSPAPGPAYMLVAVDSQGNTVPMPALTDPNSSNMVAVEASMEDGSSRTLFIDPAYLEPNVDLANLMLHIDNAGQETVIIPPVDAAEGRQPTADDTQPIE